MPQLRPLYLNRNEPGAYGRGIDACYPDQGALELALSDHLGVPRTNILITAGARGALDYAVRAAEPGTAILLDPDFELYDKLIRNERHLCRVVVPIDLVGFEFPAAGLLDALTKHVSLVVVAPVANPTGVALPPPVLREIQKLVPPGALVVIDDVYNRFHGHDYVASASLTEGLVVVRSFSKAYGACGIRVGYAVAEPGTLERLRQFASHADIAGNSVIVARERLLREDRWRRRAQLQERSRDYLGHWFKRRGVQVAPLRGNWVLANLGDRASGIASEFDRELGTTSYNVPSQPRLRGWLRISTPSHRAIKRVIAVLERVL